MEKDEHSTSVRRPEDCEAWLKTNFKLSEEDEAVTVLLNCSSLFHSVSPSLLLEHLIIFILRILMRLRTEAVGESDWRFNSSPSVGLHYLWVCDIIARDVGTFLEWGDGNRLSEILLRFPLSPGAVGSLARGKLSILKICLNSFWRNWCIICLKLL